MEALGGGKARTRLSPWKSRRFSPYDVHHRTELKASMRADLARVGHSQPEPLTAPADLLGAAAVLVLPSVRRRLEAAYNHLAEPSGIPLRLFSQACGVPLEWVEAQADTSRDGRVDDVEFVALFVSLALAEPVGGASGGASGQLLLGEVGKSVNEHLTRYLDGMEHRAAQLAVAGERLDDQERPMLLG